ncbi:RecT family recombinase [Rhizobium sp. SSA_523]|uniref:RecT family recombinase n=1 Tax=Rhizobium sp. SSA_523 TaxID=2952477 RepID=UPI0020913944|nr:RecT family recombinase [Rhizobium sp. SSA_523]MCO5730143.1 recombinase RecT [Rhizobium sp. SSA_523]WKC25207.1 RecT family recombinase [Rhizobium sp. SSA_523]
MSNQITVDAVSVLDELRVDLAPMLQESGQSFDRLRTVFMTAVQQNPEILKCSELSIKREIRKCAADGLVPDNKEAAMIPYKGELQYQPMVLGIIKRVKELGGVFSIACNLVFEKDEFILNEADPDSLIHKSDPFSKDRGKVVGGYSIFRDGDKKVMHLETMSMDDFDRVRKASKAPDSPAWKNWTNEMYRKAVLRRGAKYIAINNDKIRALLERQDDMFDFTQPRTVERVNPFTGEVIESTAAPAIEHKPQMSMDSQTGGRGDKEPAQGRQTQSKPADDQRGQRTSDRQPQGASGGKTQDSNKADKPAGPPTAPPDVSVKKDDHAKTVEAVQKILAIALTPDIDPPSMKGILINTAEVWKEQTPDYLHPLLRSCIDMTDWSIRRIRDGEPWSAEHATFVHKVKTLLDVEKLSIGKYP